MKVTLVIEEGASIKDTEKAKTFKKEIKNLYPLKEDIYSIMDRIRNEFPDSIYNSQGVRIAIPTLIKLASVSSIAISLRTLTYIQK